MVYKFRIISDEVDDFLREIKIDSEASFYDLHEAILKSTGYKDDQMTSFFICDDDWEKETEITLEDMGAGSSEEDTYVMKDTRLSELLEDERQKLLYVFDPLAERVFFIELSEIITGKDLDKAVCSRKTGEAPKQTIRRIPMLHSTWMRISTETRNTTWKISIRKVSTSTKEAEILTTKTNTNRLDFPYSIQYHKNVILGFGSE